MERWRKSLLPGQEFALSRGASLSTLCHWRREVDARAGFVEVFADVSPAVTSTTSTTPAGAMRPVGDLRSTLTFPPAVEIAAPRVVVARIAACADEDLLRRVLHLGGVALHR